MMLKDALSARYFPDQNPLRAMRLLEAGVVALALLLLAWGLVGALVNFVSGGPAPVLPSEESLQVESLALEEPLSDEAASAMVGRPLFWESRRPLDDRPVELIIPKSEPPKPKKLEGVTLRGVFGVGDSLGAIVTVNGETRRVTNNEPVKGWRLQSYSDGIAVFTNGDSRQSIPLEIVTPTVSISRSSEKERTTQEESPDTTPEQQMAATEQARERELQQQRERAERVERARAQGLTFGGGSGRPNTKKDK